MAQTLEAKSGVFDLEFDSLASFVAHFWGAVLHAVSDSKYINCDNRTLG